MKALIKLSNINQEYKNEKILSNINLTFNHLQNTVIYSDDNQIESCHFLLDILTKTIAPQKGNVEFFDDKSSQFFIGYNLFDTILEKDLIVLNILKALTTNHQVPKKEADELLKILTIDTFITKSAIDLSVEEKQLLKAYLLLLVRPQILVLKSLLIPGSEIMQTAALEYIKNYLSKYKITLIISTNDKNTINSLCARGINLSNTVVESDVSILQESQFLNNEINSKPKQYDFADDLLESIYKLEEKKIAQNESRNNEKQFVEKLLTKSLSSQNSYIPTKALDKELESIIDEKRNMQKLDIQNNSNIHTNITRTVKLMSNEELDVNQLIEVYHQRKQLQDEIESASFTNLSVTLQSKVYENYNRVNNLINKYDPTNKYDPYYRPSLDSSLQAERLEKPVYVNKVGITKMIFDENLDVDSLDINDNDIVNVNKTKQISLSSNYNDVKTKSYNTDELTKKIISASDIEYMPEDDTKKKFWNFNKKKNNQDEPIRYVNPHQENLTNEFLSKSKKTAPARVVKTEKFEPTKKLLNIEPTNFNDNISPISLPKTEAEKKKQLIELKIKKRSRLNALEELYYEALEEKENILKQNKY